MSRRTEPAATAPALTPVEQRDGVWYCGTDPWAECGRCGSFRDTTQFASCPVCAAISRRAIAALHRELDDIERLERFAETSPIWH